MRRLHPAKSLANQSGEPVTTISWSGGEETYEAGDLLLTHPTGIIERGNKLGKVVSVFYPDPEEGRRHAS